MPRTSILYDRNFLMEGGGLLIGLHGKDGSRIWHLGDLGDRPVVNDKLEDTPVLVTFDRASFTAALFDRRVDGRVLAFHRKDGKLLDRETESEWKPLTGVATAGPMKGKRLKPLPGIVSDAAAWSVFHPNNDTGWGPLRDVIDGAKPEK